MKIDDFLNPRSMITPGEAGALVTMISNVLYLQFHLLPNYTGLAASFLVGSLVFRSKANLKVWEMVVYWCLNSLIIFSVAMAGNRAGVVGGESLDETLDERAKATTPPRTPFFTNWTDGAIEERAKLTSELKKMNEETASKTLKALNIPLQDISQPKEALHRIIAGSRTAKDTAVIQQAIQTGKGGS